VEDIWIQLLGGPILMDFIIILVLRDIIVIIDKILIGGVRINIFQRSSRKPSLLILMGM